MTTRPFVDTLRDLEYGKLLDDLADAQHAVIAGVQETHKIGTVTVVLKYRYETDGQISVETDVKNKVPKMPRGTTLFFTTPEGNIQRDDPRQRKLELKKVADDKQPLKEVN